ncbi:YgaP family membrane protein [Salibacterium halotolerans]|uniref:Inner membrane protein YgaP-like transmembrane domain-containing protein n=1 Tax=Salibacterium halotolerans TaxID=1884432 RepID=A0A1I5PFI8_9BACI|nr:DUF2892 domain-containing protein [Salibacterium halotolerans]SFP32637.1 Protein of unknown function [Salibacterium halotolerans]
MRPNIGMTQAFCRIVIGLVLLFWANARSSRVRREPEDHLICLVLGAMKVAEGITRFCPTIKLYDMMTGDRQTAKNTPEHHNMHES